jgi:hypothetical protein
MMGVLQGFEEIEVEIQQSHIKVPVMHLELSFNVRYFINDGDVGYCDLLIADVQGKGFQGMMEAAVASKFKGRSVLVFLSLLEDGDKLITVPSLFEKEPSFDKKVDLSGLIINTYYPDDFRKTADEVQGLHLEKLKGKNIHNNRDVLRREIRELPNKGIEILKGYN